MTYGIFTLFYFTGYHEKDDTYLPLPLRGQRHEHRCTVDEFASKSVIRKALKRRGEENGQQSASQIGEEATMENPSIVHYLPKRQALIKMVNRFRRD